MPMIAKGDMFGPGRRVILTGLDLKIPATQENMKAYEMELQDGNFPLLAKVTLTTNDAIAFDNVDYAIMLGSFPKQEGREDREIMEKNVTIYRTFGKKLKECASKSCKVIVVGPPASTNAYICAHYADILPKENFFALTRLAQNRAAGQIALKANAYVNDVRNVVIWGRSDTTPKADLSNALVRGVAINKALAKSDEQKWLNEELPKLLENRGQDIVKARKAPAALSSSRSIVDSVRDLHFGTRSGEYISMGVWSKGNPYKIGEGMYFSFPVVCKGKGRFKVQAGLRTPQHVLKSMKEAEDSLLADIKLAKEIIEKLGNMKTGSRQ